MTELDFDTICPTKAIVSAIVSLEVERSWICMTGHCLNRGALNKASARVRCFFRFYGRGKIPALAKVVPYCFAQFAYFGLSLTWKNIMENLRDLLINELSDLYSAENQLLKALPKMAKAAFSAELKTAFEDHLAETEGQVARLDKIFEELEEKPKRKKCKAMEGLIEEGKEIIEEEGTAEVKDVALIGAGQRVEHYEIAAYGTTRAIAETLSLDTIAALLQETLDEEGQANKKLNDLATSGINEGALAASA